MVNIFIGPTKKVWQGWCCYNHLEIYGENITDFFYNLTLELVLIVECKHWKCKL